MTEDTRDRLLMAVAEALAEITGPGIGATKAKRIHRDLLDLIKIAQRERDNPVEVR